MTIIELKEKPDRSGNKNVSRIYGQLGELLNKLKERELPPEIIELVNHDIEALNTASFTDNKLIRLAKQTQTGIIRRVEKELKIVPKNYYRNLWIALGMSAFGLPIGVGIGLSLGNMAFLGIGLPIGLGLGALVGSAMDKKAAAEGRQLDIEIK